MKKRNEGFTLVELIVVIAIMAIMLSIFGVSMTLIGRQRVSNGAHEFKETMQLAQMYSKSKGACKMTIQGTSDEGSKVYIYTAANQTDLADPTKCKLGNGPDIINKKISMKVYYKDSSGIEHELEVDENVTVDIFFNRETGGMSEESIFTDGGTVTKGIFTKAVLTNGAKTITLKVAQFTGVVTME